MYSTEIISNGCKMYGGIPDDIETLLCLLARYPLNRTFERAFIEDRGGNAKRFHGNFLEISHVFDIRSNDPEVVGRLTEAIKANRRLPGFRAQPSAARQLWAARELLRHRRKS